MPPHFAAGLADDLIRHGYSEDVTPRQTQPATAYGRLAPEPAEFLRLARRRRASCGGAPNAGYLPVVANADG